MRTATYIERLTTAGIDPKTAHAHGKAIEELLGDEFVTKDFWDSRMSELKAAIYQAMFLQGVAIIGLTAGLIKLLT